MSLTVVLLSWVTSPAALSPHSSWCHIQPVSHLLLADQLHLASSVRRAVTGLACSCVPSGHGRELFLQQQLNAMVPCHDQEHAVVQPVRGRRAPIL